MQTTHENNEAWTKELLMTFFPSSDAAQAVSDTSSTTQNQERVATDKA